ncbi:hypothetical protein DFP72DRAFT_885225 [Ephemerocybe angulata]|uniref:Uncharacterized protein n=1 Tax=Ephemerocybe angulata TaxID=980116 RepID=A0A8H6MB41_9AGAR|nr:hypothetical protein DFP72DRAFT_885225 [Tulosesus angulatus]
MLLPHSLHKWTSPRYRKALNKLEKVALRCAERRGKALILMVNIVHFFQNDEDGRNMILPPITTDNGTLSIVFASKVNNSVFILFL